MQVLVDAPGLDRPLDYLVPPELAGVAVPGALVACPLGPRRVLGVVVGREPPTHRGRLVALAGAVAAPPLPPDLLALARWVAGYYAAPLAACLRLALPPGADGLLRRGRDGVYRLAALPSGAPERLVARTLPGAPPGDLRSRRRAILAALDAAGGAMAAAALCRAAGTTLATLRRMQADGQLGLAAEQANRADPGGPAPPADVPPALTAGQAVALAAARELVQGTGGPLLLHGVTGSGKTEVYLGAIQAARERGRGSLVLVPEIALTPQLLGRLRARLGDVALWHSGLTPAQRAAEHRRVREGAVDVVLGARSAVWAPVRDLGLIVVDEEHDASYKQDALPRYDARRVAFERAAAAAATILFGSATPRPESWHALPRMSLPERAGVGSGPAPRVEVVDMRTQPPGPISRPLARALRDAMGAHQKAVLLLNRRGFALMGLCRACGWIARCPRCDVSLVQGGRPPRLACHHCGHHAGVPAVCPSCRAAEVARQGAGTEGLEEALGRLLPRVRLVRMDAESTAGRGVIGRRLAEFARPGAAVLLGTQMVAKGHDLPGIALAAVVDADGALAHADFRAEERAFGLIVQVAGRAGRRGEPARVIVQAYQPSARAVRLGAALDVPGFLTGELERRRERGFPPFAHLVRLVLEGDDGSAVARLAGAVAELLRADLPPSALLGPAALHRLRGRTRRALLVRAIRAGDAVAALRDALAGVADQIAGAGVRVTIDVDPQQT